MAKTKTKEKVKFYVVVADIVSVENFERPPQPQDLRGEIISVQEDDIHRCYSCAIKRRCSEYYPTDNIKIATDRLERLAESPNDVDIIGLFTTEFDSDFVNKVDEFRKEVESLGEFSFSQRKEIRKRARAIVPIELKETNKKLYWDQINYIKQMV